MSGLVTVPAADLRTLLSQDVMHAHRRPGVWDDDNRPPLGGSRCEECAARERLRVALSASAPDGMQRGGPGAPGGSQGPPSGSGGEP